MSISPKPNSGPNDWPFDQPPNASAITLWRIIRPVDGQPPRPILFVSHNADDHGWQFLDGDDVTPKNGAVVGMGCMLDRDPTLIEIADLPPGWVATRSKPGATWKRQLHDAS
jgi:hypothetical protein